MCELIIIPKNYQFCKKSVILCHTRTLKMNNKNKQYRIEKGLLLFTQPRSPYFYGKYRINGKYKTQSFAPISDLNEAKKRLYEWKDEIINKQNNFEDSNKTISDRNEYVSFEKLDNNFQFLDVGRFDPGKKTEIGRAHV